RGGVYDIVVSNQDGMAVALFRGLSRQVGEPVVADAPVA
ncbi:MAG: phenylacetic acid degradation protein PaaD, partial [Hyphomicrobiales bacterium]|nr:phenylacetic acid degradation protein PaaD [Hyphomicrobiales bacterium]